MLGQKSDVSSHRWVSDLIWTLFTMQSPNSCWSINIFLRSSAYHVNGPNVLSDHLYAKQMSTPEVSRKYLSSLLMREILVGVGFCMSDASPSMVNCASHLSDAMHIMMSVLLPNITASAFVSIFQASRFFRLCLSSSTSVCCRVLDSATLSGPHSACCWTVKSNSSRFMATSP